MSIILEPIVMQPQFAIPSDWKLADLQARLGNIPAERIRLNPPPGYATEEDVLRIEAHENILCELDDGILVEKPMGWYESIVASIIITELRLYCRSHRLGQVLGPDGILKFLPGKIRIPDVSFVSWSRFPKNKLPRRPVPLLIPDLVVEILSDTNTVGEMDRKLRLYFETGVRLVWYVDPATKTATSFTAVDQLEEIDAAGELSGGDVLPDFRLSLRWLFEEADCQGPD